MLNITADPKSPYGVRINGFAVELGNQATSDGKAVLHLIEGAVLPKSIDKQARRAGARARPPACGMPRAPSYACKLLLLATHPTTHPLAHALSYCKPPAPPSNPSPQVAAWQAKMSAAEVVDAAPAIGAAPGPAGAAPQDAAGTVAAAAAGTGTGGAPAASGAGAARVAGSAAAGVVAALLAVML